VAQVVAPLAWALQEVVEVEVVEAVVEDHQGHQHYQLVVTQEKRYFEDALVEAEAVLHLPLLEHTSLSWKL
jgi:hypothetical protein